MSVTRTSSNASQVLSNFLLKKGDPILLQRCTSQITTFPVEEKVHDTIDKCEYALRNSTGFWKGRGMSIASTQVGEPNVNLFLVCARENWNTDRLYKKFQTILNPRITAFSDKQCLAWEGCISNDDDMCLVERPVQVKAAFQDLKGKEYEMMFTGLMARIFQHEIDHLHGILMWDDAGVPEEVMSELAEGSKIPPRKVDKLQSLKELSSFEAQETFYQANRRFIFEQ